VRATSTNICQVLGARGVVVKGRARGFRHHLPGARGERGGG